ncbi:ThuA domain-containing protein [Tamlana fucoidanivorans]|uniref:ThuA domain-containing protein n=1 Tax=Allotamlana fucoidanivorans TaxID=2583814 RepID=A0A5C4SIV2_9FLAO|nr:ThuA domain-containing protein [Tamlana fucoidanivorans]TNJ43682.1 ThuA domain-containing protein [Tamlana fucoidanivorans]
MKIHLIHFLSFCFLITSLTVLSQDKKPLVYIFSKTTGYRHTSIEPGIESIKKLGVDNNFKVKATEDAQELTANLKNTSVVVFLSTTGRVFNHKQLNTFKRFIKNGGGYVGIHAAPIAEPQSHWYTKLVGARFNNHPKQQNATLHVLNKTHQATHFLDNTWTRFDEWYNYKDFCKHINVLLTVDENSYEGGENGNFHPISWYHKTLGGSAFYTGLGHTDESFSDPMFLKHILGGITYALGR